MTQLLELQQQLVDTMRRNLGPARKVFRKMKEGWEGGREGWRRRREDREVVGRYEAMMMERKRKEEGGGEEGREGGREGVEEVTTECAVCHRSEAGGRNSIVFCDRCNMAVHTFCYCVHSLPAGLWHCQACEAALEEEEEGGGEGQAYTWHL